MGNNKKRLPFLLVLIVLLAGVLYILQTYPSVWTALPWFDNDVPSIPDTPNEPNDPVVPDNPIVPDSPILPDSPVEPDDSMIEPIVTMTGDYYTYAQMKAQLVALEQRYPERLSVDTYGVSVDGRELYVATLGDPNAPKQVIITAGMHAREYVNCYVLMQQIEYYLINYQQIYRENCTFEDLFSEVCLVIAPMTNPDGITMAQEGIEALRSSALREQLQALYRGNDINVYLNREWKSNARGVDINRNFDALWSEHVDGINQPAAKNYKGEMAGSEPETAALVRLTLALSNPVASVCVHSQGEVIYWRCNQEGAFEAENRKLAQIACDVTGYRILDSNETEPSYSNWTILALEIPTITVETGVSRYPLSYDLSDGIFDRMVELWAAVANSYFQVP